MLKVSCPGAAAAAAAAAGLRSGCGAARSVPAVEASAALPPPLGSAAAALASNPPVTAVRLLPNMRKQQVDSPPCPRTLRSDRSKRDDPRVEALPKLCVGVLDNSLRFYDNYYPELVRPWWLLTASPVRSPAAHCRLTTESRCRPRALALAESAPSNKPSRHGPLLSPWRPRPTCMLPSLPPAFRAAQGPTASGVSRQSKDSRARGTARPRLYCTWGQVLSEYVCKASEQANTQLGAIQPYGWDVGRECGLQRRRSARRRSTAARAQAQRAKGPYAARIPKLGHFNWFVGSNPTYDTLLIHLPGHGFRPFGQCGACAAS
jgi:hypothetical protein